MKINAKIKKELITSTVLLLKVTRWITLGIMIVVGLGVTAMILRYMSTIIK